MECFIFCVMCSQTMQHVLCTSLENSPQTNPIIGRIECKAGHGAGRPTQKLVIDNLQLIVASSPHCGFDLLHSTWILQIDEAADRYGFMAKMLGASGTD